MAGQYAAFMAALGTAYFFLLRFLGSVAPGLFTGIPLLKLASVLSVFASAAVLYFYIAFLRDYVRKDQNRLRKAAIWAVGGHFVLMVMYFGQMHNILGWRILPELFAARWYGDATPFFPWLALACVLVFFLVFSLEKSHGEKGRLPRAKLAALAGTGLSLVLRSIILAVYLTEGTVRWTADLPASLNFLTFSLMAASFLALEFFFLSFYKGRDLI